MLDFAVLGLLLERPRHGYEIKRSLAELGFWTVSFGSLYPSLRRLEKRGAIAATAGTGRRKSYEITDEGRTVFEGLLNADPDASETDRAFQIRLAFLGRLPKDHRERVLARRRTELSTQLKSAREILVEARTQQNPDRYRLALMEHAMRSIEADVAWLDGLIASERTLGATT
ncbi:MAG: helix-turn-helix transcriptional regulator [Acidimicrobiia bacterium]|nr:helix-turn-helix transcriptional regulator [Acidimicrobiia bacterium]